jgi:hypothetical protein
VYGNLQIVKYSAEHGADINAADDLTLVASALPMISDYSCY